MSWRQGKLIGSELFLIPGKGNDSKSAKRSKQIGMDLPGGKERLLGEISSDCQASN